MEPSTPPRRETGFPHTPATPRFGTWEDIDTQSARHAFNTPTRKPREKHTRTPSRQLSLQGLVPPTPKTTPHNRLKRSLTTPLRGSGRQGRSVQKQASLSWHDSDTHPLVLSTPQQHKEAGDPEGAWYMFRGKKVFRPFPENHAPKLKPVQLFANTANDSEEETDIEILAGEDSD